MQILWDNLDAALKDIPGPVMIIWALHAILLLSYAIYIIGFRHKFKLILPPLRKNPVLMVGLLAAFAGSVRWLAGLFDGAGCGIPKYLQYDTFYSVQGPLMCFGSFGLLVIGCGVMTHIDSWQSRKH